MSMFSQIWHASPLWCSSPHPQPQSNQKKHQTNQNWEMFYTIPPQYSSKGHGLSRSWKPRVVWGIVTDMTTECHTVSSMGSIFFLSSWPLFKPITFVVLPYIPRPTVDAWNSKYYQSLRMPCFFLYVHIYDKINLQIKHSKRLTTTIIKWNNYNNML